MAKSLVSAPAVRTWGRENIDLVTAHADSLVEGDLTSEARAEMHTTVTKCLGESARGRLNPVVISAFMAHNKGKGYDEKAVSSKPAVMVEQSYRSLDKRGRNITRKFKGTAAEARAVYGAASGKGRVNTSALVEALEQEWREAQPAQA